MLVLLNSLVFLGFYLLIQESQVLVFFITNDAWKRWNIFIILYISQLLMKIVRECIKYVFDNCFLCELCVYYL